MPRTTEGGMVVLVHPDDDTPLLRLQASLYGVRVVAKDLVEPGKAFLLDLDKLMELPERSFV